MKPTRTLAALLFAAALPLGGFAQEKPAAPEAPQPNAESPGKKQREPRPDRPTRPEPPGETVTMEKRPWLGVATEPVDPAVREHLSLAEGFGIAVEYVVEDSPAATAGIQEHDILVRLEDQRLTTPEHLAVLVRSMAKGDRVKFTLIRKGAEQTVEVVLGETDAPVQPEWPRAFGFHAQPVPGRPHQWQFQGEFPMPVPPGADGDDWQGKMRDYQDRLREWIEKNHPKHFSPQPPREKPAPKAEAETPEPAAARQPALPLPGQDQPKPAAGDSKPPSISVRPGFPIQVFSGSGMIRIDNNEGEVTIQTKDGKHTIGIVDQDGESIYQGDYDPAKGAEGLPKEAREHLKKMKLDDLKILGLPQTEGDASDAKIKIEIESVPSPDGGDAGLL
jgi:hypothetical protein